MVEIVNIYEVLIFGEYLFRIRIGVFREILFLNVKLIFYLVIFIWYGLKLRFVLGF